MAVTTGVISSEQLTWGTAAFSSWDSYTPITYNWTSIPRFDYSLDNDFLFSVIESAHNRDIGKISLYNILFSEEYVRTVLFNLELLEVLGLLEILSNNPSIPLVDSFSIIESGHNRGIGKNTLYSLSCSDTINYINTFNRNLIETLNILELARKHTIVPSTATISFTESPKAFNIGRNVLLDLNFAEVSETLVVLFIDFVENLNFSLVENRDIVVEKTELVSIFDNYIEAIEGALSDLIVSGTPITTIDEFFSLIDEAHPPGMSDFRDYIQGDYTFKNAVIRAILDSTEHAARVELLKLTADIDVPDVLDRGTATITNADTGIDITYNRNYYIVPEVTIMQKGGTTVAVPEITAGPTTTGFTVKLKDIVNNIYVTGSISWASHGY